jgi:hypothetical protein
MFNRNHYRILANAVMIMVIAFVFMDFVGLPVIRWYQTSHAIKLAKGRLDLLRADMTRDEVETTLGLSSHTGVTLGSGPPQCYMTGTSLGYGHHLGIVRDVAANPPRLISVNVDDKTWRPQDDLTNK